MKHVILRNSDYSARIKTIGYLYLEENIVVLNVYDIIFWNEKCCIFVLPSVNHIRYDAYRSINDICVEYLISNEICSISNNYTSLNSITYNVLILNPRETLKLL
jgi:hypothetical protein